MRTLCSGLFVAAALVASAAGCSQTNSMSNLGVRVPEEFVAKRSQYDTSRPFHELVKPHFFARSKRGELLEVQGSPDLILEREGKVKIRLNQEDRELTLDLLALQSEVIGEHQVHKIFRLVAMGVPIAPDLENKLLSPDLPHELFHSLRFEYLPGKDTSAVLSEVFPDGTFLVIGSGVPKEWRGDEKGIASPTHFHVDPRALSARGSSLAKEFEEEILALPFDDQRYPAAPLARKECGAYKESLQNAEYRRILSSVGYRFTPAHTVRNTDGSPPAFGETLSAVLGQGLGERMQYFGFTGYWVTERLTELQAPWVGECDTVGGVIRYRVKDGSGDRYFVTVRRSLEPDKGERYKIVTIGDDGSGEVVYSAPGIILMAQPLPSKDSHWMMSTEGWKAPEEGRAGDPRWQSVFVVNLKNPDEYEIVKYPVSQYSSATQDGSLYGASPLLTSDERFLFNTLYGFKDEGGGIWAVDLAQEEFHDNPNAFAQVVAWDHALSWIVLENDSDAAPGLMSLFMTGKEVADDFAMTANLLQVQRAGLGSTVARQERLLQMVGWNPVPFVTQRLSEHEFLVATETHLSYESSLLPRAKGVYIVLVDTTQ